MTLDQDIDRSDSYAAADAYVQTSTTLTYDQAVPDPVTGAMVTQITTNTPAQQVGVELGYDQYGRTLTDSYFAAEDDPDASPADQIGTVRTIDDAQYSYDRSGALVAAQGDDPLIVDAAGSLVNAPITDGLVTNTDVQITASANAVLPGGPAMSRSASGGTTRLERLSSHRVRVTTSGIAVGGVSASPVRADQSGSSSNGRGHGSLARTFQKQGDVWVLQEIRADYEEESPGGSARHQQVTTFRNVRWHKNKARDEERRRRREAGRSAAAGPRAVIGVTATCDGSMAIDNCATDGGDGTSGGTGGSTGASTTAGYGADCTVGDAVDRPRSPGYVTGTNIVVQHGFMDCSGSFSYMRFGNALARTFYADHVLYPTLSSDAQYEYQAAQLASIVQQKVPGASFIFVGHSNGGIVARKLGQDHPNLVRGVVSLSSPHRGVPVMKVARTMLNKLFSVPGLGMAASCAIRSHEGCSANTGFHALVATYKLGLDSLVPVSGQMVPNSPFLQGLNAAPESFRRISIEQHTRQRWVWWRVYKDLNCPGPEDYFCGGREGVRKLDKAYKHLVAQTVITGVLGFVVPGLHSSTLVSLAAVAALNAIDYIYDQMTSPGDGSDGVVPNASQSYPGAELHSVIVDADSHDAIKKSLDKGILRTERVLYERFPLSTIDGAPPH